MKLVYLWLLLVVAVFCTTLYLAVRLYVLPLTGEFGAMEEAESSREFPKSTVTFLSLSEMLETRGEDVAEALAGMTVRHFTPPVAECSWVATASGGEQQCEELWAGHGTTVEYFAPDGQVYLWYPGLNEPVVATWEVRGSLVARFICFGYAMRASDLQKGAYQAPECITPQQLYRTIKETHGTDLFGLSGGTVPHILDPEDASLEVLWRK